jgi:hypothetical protein
MSASPTVTGFVPGIRFLAVAHVAVRFSCLSTLERARDFAKMRLPCRGGFPGCLSTDLV